MNIVTRIAVAVCLVGLTLASASVHAGPDSSRVRIVVDCDQPKLPTQREVGELLDQHNFAQVYASRAALMAEAHRLCRRGPTRLRQVAFEAPSAPSAPQPQERRVAADRRDR